MIERLIGDTGNDRDLLRCVPLCKPSSCHEYNELYYTLNDGRRTKANWCEAMNLGFSSARQERLFKGVLANLQRLGYQGELLQTEYSFLDWFKPDNPNRIVPAAAFGQTPQSYDSACFAVLLSNGQCGAHLVAESRALGAPLAFEVRDDDVVYWVVGRDETSSRELLHIRPNELDAVFESHQAKWGAADVLRSKGIAFRLGPKQLDFIDLGLIPAL